MFRESESQRVSESERAVQELLDGLSGGEYGKELFRTFVYLTQMCIQMELLTDEATASISKSGKVR